MRIFAREDFTQPGEIGIGEGVAFVDDNDVCFLELLAEDVGRLRREPGRASKR